MENNKELTPMQELIEAIENQQKLCIKLAKIDKTKRKEVDAILTVTTILKIKAKSLLPKEKQVIEDAVNDQVNRYIGMAIFNIDGETYYNTKYNN